MNEGRYWFLKLKLLKFIECGFVFELVGIFYYIYVIIGDVGNVLINVCVYVIFYGGEDGENNSGKLWF